MNKLQGQKAQLDLRRVQILYENAGFPIAGIIVNTAIIFYLSYTKVSLPLSLSWLAIMVSAVPIRIALLLSFNRASRNQHLSADKIARIWENYWIIATTLLALSLVSSAYLPYSAEDQLTMLLFIGIALVAMVAGSIVASITSIKTVIVFIHLTTLPFIVRCFMEQGEYYSALGYFFIAFYLIVCSLARRMHHTLIKSIEQEIERQYMADKDMLTGLWNRRKLFAYLEEIKGQPYSLLLMDIDHFKKFNDKYGHSKGDEILIDISRVIDQCSEKGDLVVRYGGEEFLVLLPRTPLKMAEHIAETIRSNIQLKCTSTVSIGVAHTQLGQDFDKLVEVADKAMYQAKEDGRDCVRCA